MLQLATTRHNLRPKAFFLTGRFLAHCHSSLMEQALITKQAARSSKRQTLTNIDDVGRQEMAAGKAGRAHEGVAIRRHSSPRP